MFGVRWETQFLRVLHTNLRLQGVNLPFQDDYVMYHITTILAVVVLILQGLSRSLHHTGAPRRFVLNK